MCYVFFFVTFGIAPKVTKSARNFDKLRAVKVYFHMAEARKKLCKINLTSSSSLLALRANGRQTPDVSIYFRPVLFTR